MERIAADSVWTDMLLSGTGRSRGTSGCCSGSGYSKRNEPDLYPHSMSPRDQQIRKTRRLWWRPLEKKVSSGSRTKQPSIILGAQRGGPSGVERASLPANIMKDENKIREAALDVDPESFRKAGHNLIDRISDFLKQIRNVPVTSGELPDAIRQYMGTSDLPLKGQEAGPLLDRAAELLFRHSL